MDVKRFRILKNRRCNACYLLYGRYQNVRDSSLETDFSAAIQDGYLHGYCNGRYIPHAAFQTVQVRVRVYMKVPVKVMKVYLKVMKVYLRVRKFQQFQRDMM